MPLAPLTHHEILELIEPFSRAGRRVDLEATSRLERRLCFAPVERAMEPAGSPPLREDLTLENPYRGVFTLTRTLTAPDGLQARLVVEGPAPGPLLASVEAMAPASQFREGPGYAIALRHHLDLLGERSSRRGAAPRPALQQGVARVAGLTMTLTMPSVRLYPADLQLQAPPGDPIELPEDLLAVIGWDWAPLKRAEPGTWASKLRLHGRGPSRTARAEARLERTARHLAQTLAEPPARFHRRFLAARWGVVFRRTIPIWTFFAVIAGSMAIPKRVVEDNPALQVLLMNGGILIIALSFTLQEMARIELPPLPSPLRAWRPAG